MTERLNSAEIARIETIRNEAVGSYRSFEDWESCTKGLVWDDIPVLIAEIRVLTAELIQAQRERDEALIALAVRDGRVSLLDGAEALALFPFWDEPTREDSMREEIAAKSAAGVALVAQAQTEQPS